MGLYVGNGRSQFRNNILPESICNRIDNENVRIIDLIPSTPWHLAVITKKEKYVSFAAQTFIDFVLDFVHGKHSS